MFCSNCRSQNETNATSCVKCGMILTNPVQISEASETGVLKFVVPIGRTGLSIASGYLGLCSIILPIAPIALVVSIFAWIQIQKNPEKIGRGRIIFGLVTGFIGTVALAYLMLIRWGIISV